ncbi:MAG TPA: hypothetical protein VKA70_14235 [Blastocatellia bacterium]|nr:hypothetical protein [Blastocatellia bacterium]
MSELFVMRRANGDLFTRGINGELVIPVWSGSDAVARYKERNPELMIFLPARLDRSTMKKVTSGRGAEGTTKFFLLSDDAPDAYLDEGRLVTLEEIFPEGRINAPVAQAQV